MKGSVQISSQAESLLKKIQCASDIILKPLEYQYTKLQILYLISIVCFIFMTFYNIIYFDEYQVKFK